MNNVVLFPETSPPRMSPERSESDAYSQQNYRNEGWLGGRKAEILTGCSHIDPSNSRGHGIIKLEEELAVLKRDLLQFDGVELVF